MTNKDQQNPELSKWKIWVKKVGIAGVIFFTLKGIAWLFVFYFGAEMFQQCAIK